MMLEDHLQIEEILAEANAYGLRSEVTQTAAQFTKEGYSNLDAYSLAFNEWIK
ncbi:hypothetical protein OAC86_00600 [bacterium]|nr:hypothetical protein [bacterium]MDB9900025.1 hypothetical protein [bacterium]